MRGNELGLMPPVYRLMGNCRPVCPSPSYPATVPYPRVPFDRRPPSCPSVAVLSRDNPVLFNLLLFGGKGGTAVVVVFLFLQLFLQPFFP